MTCWPSASDSGCAIVRAVVSVPPPGAKPTSMRTGLVGYSAACAAFCAAIIASEIDSDTSCKNFIEYSFQGGFDYYTGRVIAPDRRAAKNRSATMGRTLKIGILEGDDIGLEVVPETVKVMKAAAGRSGLAIEWFPMPIGKTAFDQLGYTLPPGTLEKLFTLDGWVLGPIGHQAYPKDNPNAINPHPILRKNYDLFANIRPSKSLPGLPALYPDVDLIIVRENNEGFPPDRNVYEGSGEFRPSPDMTISVRVITRQASRKVALASSAQEGHRGAQEHRIQVGLRHVRRGVPQSCAGIPGSRL